MNALRKASIVTIVLAVASLASADNGEFTIAGATQFDYFFSFQDTFPAATHDFIDVDNDGVFTPNIDQLATTYTGIETEAQLLSQGPWIMNYRGTGSGTGLTELIVFYDAAPPNDCTTDPNFACDIDGTVNRWEYSYSNNYPFLPLDRIDIATMDVPASQFVSVGTEEDAIPCRKPFEPGYGKSPITPWDANSTNQLTDLGGLNTNTASPDPCTIFDFPVAWIPFTFVVSRATGIEQITSKELACLYLTGRAPCGVNYHVGTRHSGSGTRNACMSSVCVDPSWGRGDNLGETGTGTALERLGPCYQYNNITSSSTLRDCHRNNRFMISYQALYGSKGVPKVNEGWYEIPYIKFICGSNYIRPEEDVSLDEIPDWIEAEINPGDQPNWRWNVFWPNVSNGWRIGGAMVGDPYGTPMQPHLSAYYKHPMNPGMRNQDAAEFMINLLESIAAVQVTGPNAPLAGSPGQALAYKDITVAGVYGIPDPYCPSHFVVDPCLYNPKLTGLPIGNSGLDPYGSHGYGMVPHRDLDCDGTLEDYYTLNGALVVPPLDARYALQGDINQNGEWDRNDLCLAVQIVQLGAAAPVDTTVSYDILCDFDNSGVFDGNDVRYMADGLILTDIRDCKCIRCCACTCCYEVVCRLRNFIKADECAIGGNFFGTVLGTGYAYEAGDSRADIAIWDPCTGEPYAQPGAAPVADGMVDQADISHIQKVLDGRLLSDTYKYQVPKGGLCWLDASDRPYMDYSCDMNNDLVVDEKDVLIVIEDILETELGDFNLDGVKNDVDRDIIIANMGSAGTYEDGDITGDGAVNNYDLAAFDGVEPSSSSDLNEDGIVNFKDLALMAAEWLK